jgi:hypothetical protein
MKLKRIYSVYKKTEWSRTDETTFYQPYIKGISMAAIHRHRGRIVEDHGDRWVVVSPWVEVPGEIIDIGSRPDREYGEIPTAKIVRYCKSLDKREFMGSYPENIQAILYKGEAVLAVTYTLSNVRVVN